MLTATPAGHSAGADDAGPLGPDFRRDSLHHGARIRKLRARATRQHLRPSDRAGDRSNEDGQTRSQRRNHQQKVKYGRIGSPMMVDIQIAGRGRSRLARSEFAADSPLEEGVLSELVSEPKFPASWENTGNFVRRGLRVRLLARNPASNSMVCEPIPYASEQGIYFGLAGN